VLDNNDRSWSKRAFSQELPERLKAIFHIRIGRIHEKKINFLFPADELSKASPRVHVEDFRLGGICAAVGAGDNPERREVFAYVIRSCEVLLNEDRAPRAAAERLDAHGARACVTIHKNGTFDLLAENIE
jgi:hypothetical protein